MKIQEVNNDEHSKTLEEFANKYNLTLVITKRTAHKYNFLAHLINDQGDVVCYGKGELCQGHGFNKQEAIDRLCEDISGNCLVLKMNKIRREVNIVNLIPYIL